MTKRRSAKPVPSFRPDHVAACGLVLVDATRTIRRLSDRSYRALLDEVVAARKVVLLAEGRVGSVADAFARRLCDLGKPARYAGARWTVSRARARKAVGTRKGAATGKGRDSGVLAIACLGRDRRGAADAAVGSARKDSVRTLILTLRGTRVPKADRVVRLHPARSPHLLLDSPFETALYVLFEGLALDLAMLLPRGHTRRS